MKRISEQSKQNRIKALDEAKTKPEIDMIKACLDGLHNNPLDEILDEMMAALKAIRIEADASTISPSTSKTERRRIDHQLTHIQDSLEWNAGLVEYYHNNK